MKQKVATILLAFTLFAGCAGISAAAANTDQDPQARKNQMAERYEEIEKRFAALTDEQKQKIYAQEAKVLEQKEKLLQEYVALGVLTKEEADQMTGYLISHSAKAQKEGRPVGVPCPGGGRCNPKTR